MVRAVAKRNDFVPDTDCVSNTAVLLRRLALPAITP